MPAEVLPALHALGAVWPLPAIPRHNITSTFGPRILHATGRYDFNRGVTIDADEHTPVHAVLPGTLYDVKAFYDDGLTLILKHDVSLTFHDAHTTTLYSLYMRLGGIAPALRKGGSHRRVAKGQLIAYSGNSGANVDTPHLLFEVRVNTTCSLQYQIEHPTYSCARLRADPHVHPLALFDKPPAYARMHLSVMKSLTRVSDGLFEIATLNAWPLVNRLTLLCAGGAAHGDRAGERVLHVLDYSLRKGFDASTNQALDRPDRSVPHVVPIRRNAVLHHKDMMWRIHYSIPKRFVVKSRDERWLLRVRDVFGNTAEMEVAGFGSTWV